MSNTNEKMDKTKKKKKPWAVIKYDLGVTWDQLKDKNVIHFTNSIGVYDNNFYYCHQCKQPFESLTIVDSHLKTPRHQLRRQKKPDIALINILNLWSAKYKLLVKNGIFINSESTVESLHFECKMCKCTLSGKTKVFQHIHTPHHEELKKKFYQNCMKENISPDMDKNISNAKIGVGKPRSNSINACKIDESNTCRADHDKIIPTRKNIIPKRDAAVDTKCKNCDGILPQKNISKINAGVGTKSNDRDKMATKKISNGIDADVVDNARSRNRVKMPAKNKILIETDAVVDLKFNRNETPAKKNVFKSSNTAVGPKSNNIDTIPAKKKVFTNDTIINNPKCNNRNKILQAIILPSNNVAADNIKSNNHIKMPMTAKNTPKNDALGANTDVKLNNGDKISPKNKVALQKNKKTTTLKNDNRRRVVKKKINIREEKITCKICTTQVADFKGLHAHLASHYEARFKQSPQAVAQEPLEIILEPVDIATEKMEKMEKMDKQPDQSPPDDEHDQVLSTALSEENPTKIIKEGEAGMEKARAIDKVHDIRRILADVDVDRENRETDIYQMNKQQLNDIRESIYRTCIKKNMQKYCLICRMFINESKVDIFEHYRSQNHCIYLQMMREDDRAFETFSYNFSDLILAEDYIVDVSEKHVFCQACDSTILNNTNCMSMHMNTKNHVRNRAFMKTKCDELYKSVKKLITRDWYCVQRYWCVPCRRKDHLEVAFTEHLRSGRHKKKCAKFLTLGEKFDFDYCPTCVTLFYGFSDTFVLHSKCKMHKHHAKDRFFVISKLPEACKKLLTASSSDMMTELMPKSQNAVLDEQLVILDLESAVRNEFPLVKAHPFGSRVTNLSNATSDLDIFVDCGDSYNHTKSTSKTLEYLKSVEQCLKDKNDTWSIARIILHCQVPIIRAYHKPTGIECDLSFGNGLSVENTKLLRQYVENFPICRRLILFIKQWFENCDFIKINGICSYALAWLVIYYLQDEKILPTVAEAIALGYSIRIGNWESATVVMTGIKKPDDDYNFINLLRGFFTFYAHFDYHREVICPLMGATVEKLKFVEPNELPLTMRRYYDYIESTIMPKYFRIDSPMCLQDPLELSKNITCAVKKFTLYRFKKFCSFSADLLL